MPAQKRKAESQRVTGSKRRTVAKKKTPSRQTKSILSRTSPKATKETDLYRKILASPMSVNVPVQFPDQYRGRTCPLLLSQKLSFGKNTAGTHGGIRFQPRISSFWSATGSASLMSSLGWNATQSHAEYDALSNLSVSVSKYRIIAMGCSVQYVGANDSRAGTISYCFNNDMDELTLTGDSFADLHADSGILAIGTKPMEFVCRPFDHPRFVGEEASCESYINSLTLACEGVNPDDLLVKTKVFIEAVPQASSTLADSSTPSPVSGEVAVSYHTNSVMS
ncbi:MAG: hypothetical protein [Cressdnaviricota sp.]|nr:MAG: hypothetical protein [Cressdnaviricota sp.]